VKRRPQSGFTLLEALLVIVILGVAALIAFPTISRITTHTRLNQAAMVVAHDLSLAMSAAARERKPIRLARGADRQSLTVSDRVSGTLLSTRWLGPTDAYQLDSVSLTVSPVDLFPNGYASAPVTVILWAKGSWRQVAMSRAGWVRIL
jgi:prepilin-type N-terminal cleavage/methylation domain-containing protein